MKLYAFLRFVAMFSYSVALVKIDVSKSSKNLPTTTEITVVGEVVVSSSTTVAGTTKGTTTTVSSSTKVSPKTTKVATLTTPTPQKVTTLKPDSINNATKNESVPMYEWPTETGRVNKRLHTPVNYYCACDLTVSIVNDIDTIAVLIV